MPPDNDDETPEPEPTPEPTPDDTPAESDDATWRNHVMSEIASLKTTYSERTSEIMDALRLRPEPVTVVMEPEQVSATAPAVSSTTPPPNPNPAQPPETPANPAPTPERRGGGVLQRRRR